MSSDDSDQKGLGMRGAGKPGGPGLEEAGGHGRGKGWYRRLGASKEPGLPAGILYEGPKDLRPEDERGLLRRTVSVMDRQKRAQQS